MSVLISLVEARRTHRALRNRERVRPDDLMQIGPGSALPVCTLATCRTVGGCGAGEGHVVGDYSPVYWRRTAR